MTARPKRRPAVASGRSLDGAEAFPSLGNATAELDLFLSIPGDNLVRVEAHLTGTDPAAGTKQRVDNWVDFRSAQVGKVNPPDTATVVAPEAIFN